MTALPSLHALSLSSSPSPVPSTSTSTSPPPTPAPPPPNDDTKTTRKILYRPYKDEGDVLHLMKLVEGELSEPYNWYTYRYFLLDWPHLSFLEKAFEGDQPIGCIVCKQDLHRGRTNRGYIAMLSISPSHRSLGIATHLVRLVITKMVLEGADEVVLETESDNEKAIAFYTRLGFIKEKRLYRFYLNAKDAFRLVLPLPPELREEVEEGQVENELGYKEVLIARKD